MGLQVPVSDIYLHRYSAEFTIYREMLQNANDAGAKQFKLKFDLNEDGLVKTLCFINDGRIFTKEDWSRLCRIAEGNPDENKVLTVLLYRMYILILRLDSLELVFTACSRYLKSHSSPRVIPVLRFTGKEISSIQEGKR